MTVQDHGIEVLKKAGEELGETNETGYYIKVSDAKSLAKLEEILSALGGSGKLEVVKTSLQAIVSGAWTKVIATALVNRSTLTIQNNTGQLVKLNSDNGAGFTGLVLNDGDSYSYTNITAAFTIYARSETSNVSLDIEELASV